MKLISDKTKQEKIKELAELIDAHPGCELIRIDDKEANILKDLGLVQGVYSESKWMGVMPSYDNFLHFEFNDKAYHIKLLPSDRNHWIEFNNEAPYAGPYPRTK